MKLNNVEVSGFNTIVIHTPMNDGSMNSVVFNKRDSDERWVREGHPTDIHNHVDMVNKIKKFTYSPYHKVWINGTFVNISPLY